MTQHNWMHSINNYFYCMDSARHLSENATCLQERDGETMAVRCNNNRKHMNSMTSHGYGCSENHDTVNTGTACLYLLSCPTAQYHLIRTDGLHYETGNHARCSTVSSPSSRISHTTHPATLATVLESLGTYRTENTGTLLTNQARNKETIQTHS